VKNQQHQWQSADTTHAIAWKIKNYQDNSYFLNVTLIQPHGHTAELDTSIWAWFLFTLYQVHPDGRQEYLGQHHQGYQSWSGGCKAAKEWAEDKIFSPMERLARNLS
jgi:hypothetical protein